MNKNNSNSNNSQIKKFNTKTIVTVAMLVALAFVTSFIALWKMPMGGTVTLLSMFFITYIGYLFGPIVGLISGLVYGLLQFVADPYILSVPQVIVDYGLAFMALGLSGFFCKKKNGLQIGYIVGILGRLAFATLSGIIFFGVYGNEYGMSAFTYSIAYNGLYIGAEAVITIILMSIPAFNKQLVSIKNKLS